MTPPTRVLLPPSPMTGPSYASPWASQTRTFVSAAATVSRTTRTFSGTTPWLPSPQRLRRTYHFAASIFPDAQSSLNARRAPAGPGPSFGWSAAASSAAAAPAERITHTSDTVKALDVMRGALLNARPAAPTTRADAGRPDDTPRTGRRPRRRNDL